MTSEIRANKQTNRAGLGTVTYADTGIIVSGIVTCTELSGLTALNIAGVGTASTLDINGDIDVDGHTNLDNVSIAGISTFTSRIDASDNIAITSGNRLYFGNSDVAFIKGEHGGSGYLSFGANNEHMRLTRAGNLGIGTDNPQCLLDMSKDISGGVNYVDIRNHHATGGAALRVKTQGTYASPTYQGILGASDAGGTIRVGAVSNHPLLLLVNNQEKARITTGGEFQIPHFSPPDGSSASRAARSALEIKRYYPQKTSGNYWIKDNNGTARQIYCEMETDGGGWMLWHDHNAPNSKVSMNIALGGSDASPSSNLARSNYNNYVYYTVWIKASQIDATGERLHSFVTLDQNGEIKYIADYGADFLYEHVGDKYQPNRNDYFHSDNTTEYVSNTEMYDPQCGATGWESFSNGGWSEVYIREMDTRINPGDHRGLHLVERIYGFDSAGVPRWSVAESNQPLPYWSDVCLRNGESANGAQDMLSFGNRRLKADAGNNGPSIQGRSKGILTGTFEYEFQLGYLWGWSIGSLVSTIQIENSIKTGITTEAYSHYSQPYFHASLYNNSSNNLWYATTRPDWQNSDTNSSYSGGVSSGSNVLWRETDGTIKAKTKGANVSHTHTFPFKFAGPLILCSGNQSPHFTYLYDVWNDDKNDSQLNSRNRWYK